VYIPIEQAVLLDKVNRILGKDVKHQALISTIEDLAHVIEDKQEENNLMAEKHAERDIEFAEFMRIIEQQGEENLRMAEELALLKGEMSG